MASLREEKCLVISLNISAWEQVLISEICSVFWEQAYSYHFFRWHLCRLSQIIYCMIFPKLRSQRTLSIQSILRSRENGILLILDGLCSFSARQVLSLIM